jgi:circadian clock protein KaiB
MSMVKSSKKSETTRNFEKAAKQPDQEKYVLKLYITGMTPRSRIAIHNLQKLCEEHLKGNYNLEVIDIYQQPALAKGEQIIAVPTLIKKLPEPVRRLIGDMSTTDRVILGLDLKTKK